MRPGWTFRIISLSPMLPRQLPSSARVMFTRGPTMRKSLKATLVPSPARRRRPPRWPGSPGGLVSPGAGVVTGTGAPEGVAQARTADDGGEQLRVGRRFIPTVIHRKAVCSRAPGGVRLRGRAQVPGLGATGVVGMGADGEGCPPRDRSTAPKTSSQAEIIAITPTKGISLTSTTIPVPMASWMTPSGPSLADGDGPADEQRQRRVAEDGGEDDGDELDRDEQDPDDGDRQQDRQHRHGDGSEQAHEHVAERRPGEARGDPVEPGRGDGPQQQGEQEEDHELGDRLGDRASRRRSPSRRRGWGRRGRGGSPTPGTLTETSCPSTMPPWSMDTSPPTLTASLPTWAPEETWTFPPTATTSFSTVAPGSSSTDPSTAVTCRADDPAPMRTLPRRATTSRQRSPGPMVTSPETTLSATLPPGAVSARAVLEVPWASAHAPRPRPRAPPRRCPGCPRWRPRRRRRRRSGACRRG